MDLVIRTLNSGKISGLRDAVEWKYSEQRETSKASLERTQQVDGRK